MHRGGGAPTVFSRGLEELVFVAVHHFVEPLLVGVLLLLLLLVPEDASQGALRRRVGRHKYRQRM